MSDIIRGGQFLVKETKCEDIFTPEDFNEEQVMMRDSVIEFVDKEIWPNKDRFEHNGRGKRKNERRGESKTNAAN